MCAQIIHRSKMAKKKKDVVSDAEREEELANQEEIPIQNIIDVPRLNVQYYRSPNPL